MCTQSVHVSYRSPSRLHTPLSSFSSTFFSSIFSPFDRVGRMYGGYYWLGLGNRCVQQIRAQT